MVDLSSLTPRELGSAVTPLFILDSRFQQEALNELIIRCEVADRLTSTTRPEAAPKPLSASGKEARQPEKQGLGAGIRPRNGGDS